MTCTPLQQGVAFLQNHLLTIVEQKTNGALEQDRNVERMRTMERLDVTVSPNTRVA